MLSKYHDFPWLWAVIEVGFSSVKRVLCDDAVFQDSFSVKDFFAIASDEIVKPKRERSRKRLRDAIRRDSLFVRFSDVYGGVRLVRIFGAIDYEIYQHPSNRFSILRVENMHRNTIRGL